MKTQQDKWEADIRQKVEQHEFEYDSMAWAEMDQLLNQTALGGSTSASSALKTGLSWWWQVALIIGISTIVGLLIYQWNKREKTPESIELSSFSIPESETVTTLEDTIQTTTIRQLEALDKLPVLDIQSINGWTVHSLPDNITISWRPNTPTVFERLPVYPQPVFREQQLKLEGIKTSTDKRKRNPKTLFPDVIENYK
jgi:hypothetical protein